MASPEEKLGNGTAPNVWVSLIPIIVLVCLLSCAYYLYGDDAAGGANQIALLFSALTAAFIGRLHGWSFEEMRDAAVGSVTTGISAVFILLAVGSLIGTWAMSGTLISMVYWGLKILSPDYFYFTVVIICALIALSLSLSLSLHY